MATGDIVQRLEVLNGKRDVSTLTPSTGNICQELDYMIEHGGGGTGKDGITPTTTITEISGGHNIAFSYGEGDSRNTDVDVMDGSDGAAGSDGSDGADGITPTTTVTTIVGGHNVAFSYGSGDSRNTDFDVMDGVDGSEPFVVVQEAGSRKTQFAFTSSSMNTAAIEASMASGAELLPLNDTGLFPGKAYVSVYANGDWHSLGLLDITAGEGTTRYIHVQDAFTYQTSIYYYQIEGEDVQTVINAQILVNTPDISQLRIETVNAYIETAPSVGSAKLHEIQAVEPTNNSDVATKYYVDSMPGQPGADGITPTTTITQITGGHNVAFSYGQGDSRNVNFDVMDGATGQTGQTGPAGYTPVRGTDYWTSNDVSTMEAYCANYIDTQLGTVLSGSYPTS